MKVQVDKAEGTKCVVRVGPRGREDKDSEIRIVRSTGDGADEWELVERVFVLGKKKLDFDLPEGAYHVMVVGDKKAGVATTAGHDMPFPFNVFLEPPKDGSKEWLRLDVPTDVPLTEDVAAAIKKSLK